MANDNIAWRLSPLPNHSNADLRRLLAAGVKNVNGVSITGELERRKQSSPTFSVTT